VQRNPFIAGSWVRGDNFFGRTAILREVLEGQRHALWVVGPRRLGKTSLLKQLEYVTQTSAQSPFVPLYWDLQGSADARGLADGFLGSVEDSEAFRRATDVAVEDLEGLSVAEMLTTAVRKTVRAGWRLLLLLDEAEELLTLARSAPSLLPRLRRVLQKGPDVRAVLTSTRRLARLDDQADLLTSPFLQGFSPPIYLPPLEADEGRALLARGEFSPAEVEEVLARTARHPFLVQLIASRLFEGRDVQTTLDQVASDEMVANFFSVDFHTLEASERALLEELARESGRGRAALAEAVGLAEDTAEPLLFGLEKMGYLAVDAGVYRIGNWFFERWLRRVVAARATAPQA
jgi:hypothetical protein